MIASFRVDEPFRIYRHAGWSRSNSYYGSSRLNAGVFEAINTRAGDEIHALPGGLFLVRGDEACRVSLDPPKGAFEKSYGVSTPEERLRRSARVSEFPATQRKAVDYAAAGKAAEKMFPDNHPTLVVHEDSPELQRLFEAFDGPLGQLDELAEAGEPDSRGQRPHWRHQDHTHQPIVGFQAYHEGWRSPSGKPYQWPFLSVEWAYVPDLVWLHVDSDLGADLGREPKTRENGQLVFEMPLGEAVAAVQAIIEKRFAPGTPAPGMR